MAHAFNSSTQRGGDRQISELQASQGYIVRETLTQNKYKNKGLSMYSIVDCLPSMLRALGQPAAMKIKKQKTKIETGDLGWT